MDRLLPLLGCVVVCFSSYGCKQEESAHQQPVWSDLEHQSRAHHRTRPNPAASASTSAPAGVRLAKPLEVDPLPKPCEVTDRVGKLSAGEVVLVSPIRVNFVLAEVVTPEREGKVVVASRHGNEFVAASEHVYALRPSRQSKAKANCYGACKPASGWVPCLVTRRRGTQITARDRDDRELTLRQDEVVIFDPVVQNHVRDFFQEAHYERAFTKLVQQSGGPLPPPRHRPEEGDVVLADFGEKYLLAQVTDVGGDTCTVAWLASSMKPGVRKLTRVVPLPTAYGKPARPSPGDFVLAHARGKLAAEVAPLMAGSDEVRTKLPAELWSEWEPMRVEAVYPDGRLLLSDVKQKQHEDTVGRIIPFRSGPQGKPAAPPDLAAPTKEQ